MSIKKHYRKDGITWKLEDGIERAYSNVDGKIMHGHYRHYYDDGTINQIGTWINGLKEGAWQSFDENGKLFGRGFAWLDTGTHQSLLQASHFIQTVEERQGLKIGCIEEVAYRMGTIDHAQFVALGEKLSKSGYGQYILQLAKELMNNHPSL